MDVSSVRLEDRLAGEGPGGGQVDPSPMFGTWHNTDKQTGGIVRMALAERNGIFIVHAWAAGSPDLYDWGEVAATAHAANVHSHEGMAFLAAYTKRGILVLDTFNTFKDGSGRSNYFTRELFHR